MQKVFHFFRTNAKIFSIFFWQNAKSVPFFDKIRKLLHFFDKMQKMFNIFALNP